MKHRVLCIAVLIAMGAGTVYGLTADEIIQLRPMIEIGYVLDGAVVGYEVGTRFGYDAWTVDYHDHELYTILAVRIILLKLIYTGGEISVVMKPVLGCGVPSFDPQFVSYRFEAGLQWREVRVYYEHECAHPQRTYPGAYRMLSVWGESSVDRIGIRIGGMEK